MIGLFTKRVADGVPEARSLWWLWLGSGIVLALAFLTPYSGWLVIPGLWLYWTACQRAPSWRSIFWGSLLAFSVKSLGAISGCFHTYPLQMISDLSPQSEYGLIVSTLLYFSIAIALGQAAILTSWFVLSKRSLVLQWSIPIAWVVAEVAGSFIFSLAALGPGSTLNIDFSFGYVGYLLADSHVLLYAARLGGVYVLTGVLIAGTYGLFVFLQRKRVSYAAFVLLLVLTGILVTNQVVPSPVPPAPAAEITVVHTEFPHRLTDPLSVLMAQRMRVRDQVREQLATKPAVIVLPEGAELTLNFTDPRETLAYLSEHAEAPVIVIDSLSVGSTITAGQNTVRAYIYDTGRQAVYIVDKQKLTPIGEYVPYFFTRLTAVLPFVPDWQNTAPAYQPGLATSYDSIPEEVPSVLFCFESISPLSVRRLLTDRSTTSAVVHITSYAWFHQSKALFLAVDRMIAVQSVWNQVPIVAANNMKSATVQPWERLLGW